MIIGNNLKIGAIFNDHGVRCQTGNDALIPPVSIPPIGIDVKAYIVLIRVFDKNIHLEFHLNIIVRTTACSEGGTER